MRRTGRVRAVVLKGRQQGCSTYVAARFYWKVTHRKGARAFILTHLDEASQRIHEIVRRLHENCPEAVRPHASQSSARALHFDRLDSGYAIGRAWAARRRCSFFTARRSPTGPTRKATSPAFCRPCPTRREPRSF